MRSAFQEFAAEQALWQAGDRILAAVSGGLDSVVLAHLLHLSGLPFGIAHMNFSLRGAASDEDARFVSALSARYGVPCFSRTVNTRAGQEAGESLQMTARRLRYTWLEETRNREGYDWVATAHHVDDSIETFLLNFAKGTGLSGLLGIPPRTGRVVRPLLFATRLQIQALARQEGLSWREDASNEETKYDRNKIRLQALPVLRELNPSLSETSVRTFAHLREAALLAGEAVQSWRSRCVEKQAGRYCIRLAPIVDHPALESLLFAWLNEFGFSSGQVAQITDRVDRTGARFASSTHRLLVDRNQILVERLPEKPRPADAHQLAETGSQIRLPGLGTLSASSPQPLPATIPNQPWQAWLDAERISFPLTVRHWEPGDVFQPLGMEGSHQKVQDFFTHLKLDRFQKERVWLVETANGEICWILGYRIDHRFRLRSASQRCIVLTLLQDSF